MFLLQLGSCITVKLTAIKTLFSCPTCECGRAERNLHITGSCSCSGFVALAHVVSPQNADSDNDEKGRQKFSKVMSERALAVSHL